MGLVCRSIVLGFEVFAASEEKKRKDIQTNAPSKKISLTLRNLDVFGLLLTQNKGPEGFEENPSERTQTKVMIWCLNSYSQTRSCNNL